MADIKTKYGTSNQPVTLTLSSLANNGARASAYIDNSTNLYQDVLFSLTVKSGTVATGGYVAIYAYATVDSGANYTDGATGLDAGITLASPNNLKPIGIINTPTGGAVYKSGPFPIAAAFGGNIPERWGIVVENKTGGTLDATESNHSKVYQGVYSQAI